MAVDLAFLTSARGEELLQRLAHEDLSDANTLSLLSLLRKSYAPAQASAALEQARLRLKAVEKFGSNAARLFFTRDALEQASDPFIRAYRSRMFSGHVIDACCAIGTDALAFAQAGHNVLGLDLDAERIALAQHNARALGLDSLARFAVHDVTRPLPEPADAIFFDPARRDAIGRRLNHVEAYLPPLSTLRRWDAPQVAAKLSPAVSLDEIRDYGGRVEFLSVDGDLKEALLLPSESPLTTRAVLFSAGQTLSWDAHTLEALPGLADPRAWLIEPDPAIIRAGLVQHAAIAWDATMLDPTIAYMTADSPPETPWARGWQILDWMPFNLKKLKAALRACDVGTVTVKKRGHAMTPESLITALKPNGSESRTLVLTRLHGQPVVLICADITVAD